MELQWPCLLWAVDTVVRCSASFLRQHLPSASLHQGMSLYLRFLWAVRITYAWKQASICELKTAKGTEKPQAEA